MQQHETSLETSQLRLLEIKKNYDQFGTRITCVTLR